MKKVSLRDFVREPTKYLGDLPIEITRYSKSIARIVQLEGFPTKEVMEEISQDLSDEFHPIPKPKK